MLEDYNTANKYYSKKEYTKAYDILLNLAEDGDINSQLCLGGMVYYGKGTVKDIAKAYYWYELAAKNENAEALYYCAMHYIEDLGEIEKGKKYLDKAVRLKYVPAMIIYAYYHEYGDYGYPKDTDISIDLYKQSCIFEKSDACIHLYTLMISLNRTLEFQKFIEDNIGKFRFLIIIIKENWKNFIHWLPRRKL